MSRLFKSAGIIPANRLSHVAFEKCKQKTIPSNFLCRLMLYVLQRNTLKFGQGFYCQTKGCETETPMAVIIANIS